MANPSSQNSIIPKPSDSPRSSIETKHDSFSDSESESMDVESPPTSPEISHVAEPKDLLGMYTNVEIGVAASLIKRDDCLVSLAEIKQGIAKARRDLAHWESKETSVLHRLQCIREELAEKRVTQADINVERARTLKDQLCDKSKMVGRPRNILSTLLNPSAINFEDIVMT